MTSFNEVLFVSDTVSSVQAYDLTLGVRLTMYKGGRGLAKRTLNCISEDFIISGETSRPFLYVWALNKEEPVKVMSVPGKVTALGVSPNGFYCAAGIENKIYIWNVASGQLLNVLTYHHEAVTKIIFWNCKYLVTSGEDGLVAVWRLADVIAKETGDNFNSGQLRYQVPFFSSSQHSLPVTDMYLAAGGSTARLFTVSADQTCQIFSLSPDSGRFLLTLTFDFVLTTVCLDRLQRQLFVGTNCGKVILFPMDPCHDTAVRHVDSSDDANAFVGHSASINTLSLSSEDTVLASGSDDKKIILWNVATRQQIKMYQMFGEVTNAFFHIVAGDFLTSEAKPTSLVSNFSRTIVSEPEDVEIKFLTLEDLSGDSGIEEEIWSSCMGEKHREVRSALGIMPDASLENSDEDSDGAEDGMDSNEWNMRNANSSSPEDGAGMEILQEASRIPGREVDSGSGSNSEVSRLRLMNKRLMKINRRLYMFGLEQLWQNGYIREKRHAQNSKFEGR